MPTQYQVKKAELLLRPDVSFWLKEAIKKLDGRDPLDAANDAEQLHALQNLRWQEESDKNAETPGSTGAANCFGSEANVEAFHAKV